MIPQTHAAQTLHIYTHMHNIIICTRKHMQEQVNIVTCTQRHTDHAHHMHKHKHTPTRIMAHRNACTRTHMRMSTHTRTLAYRDAHSGTTQHATPTGRTHATCILPTSNQAKAYVLHHTFTHPGTCIHAGTHKHRHI